jgi:DNA end-binding protein Ku
LEGHLKLSLVSCPIALYAAVDYSERVSFRQVNRITGNRVRQQLADSVTGQAVQTFDKARGYEVAENQFVVAEDEDLKQARASVKPNIQQRRGNREAEVWGEITRPSRDPTPASICVRPFSRASGAPLARGSDVR